MRKSDLSRSTRRWTTFHVPDMDCPQELKLIQKGLETLPGIDQLKPDYLGRELRIQYDSQQTDPERMGNKLAEIGFPPSGDSAEQTVRTTNWSALLRGSPTTLLAGVLWILAAVSTAHPAVPKWCLPTFSAATVLVAGRLVVRKGLRSIRLRQLDMHALITLAMIGAMATGEWLEAATVMVLFRVSLLIEQGSQQRANRAIQALLTLSPNECERMMPDGQTESANVDQLNIGDQVLVRPGQRIPTDGVVTQGASSVDEAPITGESVPVEKEPGDKVYAGTLCGEGILTLEVQRASHDSTLARITRLVEKARSQPAHLERMVDQFARWYTPAVIALACVVAMLPPLVFWLRPDLVPSGESLSSLTSIWFFRALVILVIACPCALVISTPVTVVCGLYRATKLGILVKGAVYLEQMGQLRAIALDKTGTVTQGLPKVVGVDPVHGSSKDEILQLAASLERNSEHPLARAVSRASRLDPQPCRDFQVLRGFGVQGSIEGTTYTVASERYFYEQHPALAEEVRRLAKPQSGATTAFVARHDGSDVQILGVIFLQDQPRDTASQAIQRLRDLDVRPIIMLTGDRREAAQPLADALGFDECYANLLPQDKIDHVQSLTVKYPKMAMAGDGVNDAPALAAAPIGIAVGAAASDVALETADIAILSAKLGRIADLVSLSRRVRTTLATNIGLAIGIKLAVLLAAMCGFASMWMAVAADAGASLVVIANGMRVLR